MTSSLKKNLISFKTAFLMSFVGFLGVSSNCHATAQTQPTSPTMQQPETQSTPTPATTKIEILVQAADLERQATKKQPTDINAANALRAQAKQLRDQANKIK